MRALGYSVLLATAATVVLGVRRLETTVQELTAGLCSRLHAQSERGGGGGGGGFGGGAGIGGASCAIAMPSSSVRMCTSPHVRVPARARTHTHAHTHPHTVRGPLLAGQQQRGTGVKVVGSKGGGAG